MSDNDKIDGAHAEPQAATRPAVLIDSALTRFARRERRRKALTVLLALTFGLAVVLLCVSRPIATAFDGYMAERSALSGNVDEAVAWRVLAYRRLHPAMYAAMTRSVLEALAESPASAFRYCKDKSQDLRLYLAFNPPPDLRPDLYVARARCDAQFGDDGAALADYDRAVGSFDTSSSFLSPLSIYLGEAGFMEETGHRHLAQALLDRAMRLSPPGLIRRGVNAAFRRLHRDPPPPPALYLFRKLAALHALLPGERTAPH